MRRKVSQVNEALGALSDAPRKFGEKIDRLKQSPGGQKLIEADARFGRYYATIQCLIWLAAGIPVLIVGYLLVLASDGLTETIIVAATTIVIAGLIWKGIACIRNARAASEIMVEELEGRVRPARWALRLLKSMTGLGRPGHER